jgi:hypothetical protein
MFEFLSKIPKMKSMPSYLSCPSREKIVDFKKTGRFKTENTWPPI